MWAGNDTAFTPDPLARFLGQVLPWVAGTFVNIHAIGGVRTRYAGGGRAFNGWEEWGLLAQHVGWLNVNQSNAFFCLSCVATYDSIDQRGKRKAVRKKNGIIPHSLKAWVIDLDVKKGAYASQADALRAALPFLDEHGLKASVIVSTGNGIHIYIALDQPIPLNVWQPLADRLIEATRAKGIRCDVGVTRNPVTLLRLPTTSNWKDAANPKPCRVLKHGPDMTLAEVQAALAAYTPTPGVRSTSAPLVLDPAVFPQRPPIINGPDHDRVCRDFLASRQRTSFELLRAACAVVRDSAARGGDGDPEPLWFELAKLCQFVPDGREHFHSLSKGDARYDPEQVDRKFDEQFLKRWPSCAEIGQHAGNYAHCQSCQWYTKGESPIDAAMLGPTTTPYVNGHSHTPTTTAFIAQTPIMLDLPDGYVSESGMIFVDTNKKVFNWPVWAADYTYNRGVKLTFPVSRQGNEIDTMFVLPSDIVTSQTLATRFSNHLPYDDDKRVRKFVNDLQTMIRERRTLHKESRPGWVRDTDDQIVGFRVDTEDERYKPYGSLDGWKQYASRFVGKGCTALEVGIAAGIAGPLVSFTPVDTCQLHLRTAESGMGKSAMAEAGCSIFGPSTNIVQNTTANALIDGIAEMYHLTIYQEEAVRGAKGSKQTQHMHSLILDISSGTDRRRMSKNLKVVAPRTWRSMVVSMANYSAIEASAGVDTNAQVMRVLEIGVERGISHLNFGNDVFAIREGLQFNRGQAGQVVSAFLNDASGRAWAKAAVAAVREKFDSLTGNHPDARFWVATAAVLFVASRIMKELDLLDFDLGEHWRFLLTELRRQRANLIEMDIDPSNPSTQLDRVVAFLNENLQSIIQTKTVPVHGTNRHASFDTPANQTNISRSREFVARLAMQSKTLEVSEYRLKSWCERKNYSYPDMKKVLLKHRYCVVPKYKRSLARRVLGLTSGEEKVLEFDLSNPNNSVFLGINVATGDDDGHTVSS